MLCFCEDLNDEPANVTTTTKSARAMAPAPPNRRIWVRFPDRLSPLPSWATTFSGLVAVVGQASADIDSGTEVWKMRPPAWPEIVREVPSAASGPGETVKTIWLLSALAAALKAAFTALGLLAAATVLPEALAKEDSTLLSESAVWNPTTAVQTDAASRAAAAWPWEALLTVSPPSLRSTMVRLSYPDMALAPVTMPS